MPTLNKRTLKALKPKQWAVENVGKGQPQLRAKGSPSGLHRFYLRYSRSDGTQDDLPIGAFDDLGAARRAAAPLIARYRAGTLDLREAIAAEKAAAEAAKRAADSRRANTVGTVLTAYCNRLERDKKASAAEVRAMLLRHVKPLPHWSMPALDFRAEHAVEVLAPLLERAHERTAQKLRSALRAAFKLAAQAATDPKAPAELRAIGLRVDPLAALRTIERRDPGTRERALSPTEWRAVWAALREMPNPDGAALKLHILLGGQRVQQLARCTLADFDRDAMTLRILDPKGRRVRARVHVIPVIDRAAAEIEALHAGGSLGPWLMSLDRGASPVQHHHLHYRWRELSERLIREGAITAPVTPGDVRRSLETQMARLGISAEVRAVLQSHGLGGVVWKHYQRHDFLPEMREALERFADFLEGAAAAVVPLRRWKT
jgi:integrase